MPGSLAELYGALLKQEPQGILGAARFNPLMMAKALRQQQANPRPSLSSLMNYPQTWQQFGDNIQAHYPTDSPAAVRQAAFEAAKNAGPLMTVWQGSPHKFAPTKNNPLGEFDATKIGTGEGAQAYGYGHYLAENPTVAKEYQKALGSVTLDGAKNNSLSRARNALSLVADEVSKKLGRGPTDAELLTAAKDMRGKLGTDPYYADLGKRLDDGIGALEAGTAKTATGSLYKVDLPDDQIAKMLDWDKPLSQQPESVRKAIANSPYAIRDMAMEVSGMSDPTGAALYQVMMNKKDAAEHLRSLGIPGIRYLDQGSRGAGSGTSNFVVFPGNEGILKILARE